MAPSAAGRAAPQAGSRQASAPSPPCTCQACRASAQPQLQPACCDCRAGLRRSSWVAAVFWGGGVCVAMRVLPTVTALSVGGHHLCALHMSEHLRVWAETWSEHLQWSTPPAEAACAGLQAAWGPRAGAACPQHLAAAATGEPVARDGTPAGGRAGDAACLSAPHGQSQPTPACNPARAGLRELPTAAAAAAAAAAVQLAAPHGPAAWGACAWASAWLAPAAGSAAAVPAAAAGDAQPAAAAGGQLSGAPCPQLRPSCEAGRWV